MSQAEEKVRHKRKVPCFRWRCRSNLGRVSKVSKMSGFSKLDLLYQDSREAREFPFCMFDSIKSSCWCIIWLNFAESITDHSKLPSSCRPYVLLSGLSLAVPLFSKSLKLLTFLRNPFSKFRLWYHIKAW